MQPRGFTLIEVLVAIAIIAILALAVTIGLSGLGGNRELQHEAERLRSHLAWACESAELDGHAIGFRQTGAGYEFLQHHAGRWQRITTRDALAAYRLPAGTTLALVRDGERVAVTPAPASSAAVTPALACFPSGELTPFVATLAGQGADRRYRIEGKADGELSLDTIDAQN